MEQKNRKFIVIAIIALISVALVASFGRSLFTLNTPSVILPSSSSEPDDSSIDSSQTSQYQRVEVTTQTVVSVVATLTRPESFYRELTVDTFWGEAGSSSTQVQVWADGGWTHCRQVRPSGVIRHDLTGDETWYYWYENSTQYQTAPADERSPDLVQHIPTYEDVLALDAKDIIAASYENRSGLPCIYVEVRSEDSDLRQRYWVSTDNGLLISAETLDGERVVYRMSAYSPVQSPCPNDGRFTLPDGSVLHTVGG